MCYINTRFCIYLCWKYGCAGGGVTVTVVGGGGGGGSSSDRRASTVRRHQIAKKKNHNFQCQIVIFFSHYQHLPVLQREANTNHVKPCRSLRLVAFCFVYHWVHLEYTRGECGGVQINSLHLCSFVASLELATKGHFADVHSSSKYYKKPKTYRSFTWFGFVFNKHYYFLMLRVK